MSKTIEFYFSCTKDKLITHFNQDGTFVAFLANGKRLYDGVYIEREIEGCKFYFLNDNLILIINSASNSVLFLQQYEKYTYVYSTFLYDKKPVKNLITKQNVTFCITDFNKDKKDNLNIEQLAIIEKDVKKIFFDYHKQNKFKSFFFPTRFVKKLSCLNFLIFKSKSDIISLLDIANNIDLKFLIETYSLKNDTLLVPNIIHQNEEILPISFSRQLIQDVGLINENDSQNKFLVNLIINSFIKGKFIKTYPLVINNFRIRGNFDNISEEAKEILLKDFKQNTIFKLDDFKSYNCNFNIQLPIEFK